METQDILKQCKIENLTVKLPEIQLDRKEYLDVKKQLELIGGKWKGGKTQGFVFKLKPDELLKQITGGEKRNLKKEFQFFATPQKLAEKMVYLADIQNHDKVLEPSAGQGAIIEEINKVSSVLPDCCEIMELNRVVLKEKGLDYNLVEEDFFDLNGEYNKIIANPPFSKNQDIKHIMKMVDENLVRGGRLVCICSKHWENSNNKVEKNFRNWLEEFDYELTPIEKGEFKESGTNIETNLLTINKSL